MNHLLSRPSVRFLLLMLSLALALQSQTTLFVDADATGANNGTSWSDAYTDLQDALGAAVSGDEIWVAAGTYTPTSGTDRILCFFLKNGVGLYGGFAGSETLRTQRDPATNPTILSGDLNGDDGSNFSNNGENSYHVVFASSVDASTVLDGFTIRGGNANGGIDLYNNGGGLLNYNSSPSVRSCTFSGNAAQYGGAIYNYASSSSISHCIFSSNTAGWGGGMANGVSSNTTIEYCTFSGNSATLGGGMNNHGFSTPTIRYCTFSGNSAATGGGMFGDRSNTTISHCTFIDNSAANFGGGMSECYSNTTISHTTFSGNQSGQWGAGVYINIDCTTTISHCTFTGNSAIRGGGIFNSYSNNSTIRFSILWGNVGSAEIDEAPAIVNNCVVQGGYAGGTNIITDDPLLGPLADNGGPTQTHALLPGSPAIDAAAGSTETTDQRGVARPQGPARDIGAYEYGALTGILHVTPIGAGSRDGSSWDNAMGNDEFAYALPLSAGGAEYWVAAGTYVPTSGSDRTISFVLKSGVGLYGGFSGSETLRSQRDPAANITILSGDLNGDDDGFTNNGENSYHVVWAEYVNAGTVLDGFTIRGGNANNAPNPHFLGGGMYFQGGGPTISHCIFMENSANYGGAIYNLGSNFTLSHCTLSGNSANNDGGGMYNANSSPTISHCTFSGNTASGIGEGGGIFDQASNSFTISHCTFSGNSAYNGGGMYLFYYLNSTILHCTFSGNSASSNGSGIYDSGYGATIRTSIFWDNTASNEITGSPTVSDSIVRGGYAAGGTGIITEDPLLGPLADNGGPTLTHALLPGSPAIDAAAGSTETTDQRGVARPQGPASDIGAYEEEYHTVSFQAGPGGILSGTSYQSVVEGGSTSPVTALPAAGHAFVNWTGTGFATTTSNPLTVTNVSGDMTLTANFITLQYTLTPSAGAGGTISPATPQTVNHGANATFTISPDAGRHIADVRVDGVSVGAVGSYTFTNVSRNHTISANFDNLPPLVTILEPAEGSTVLGRVTVRAQIFDDDGIVSSELRVNGQVVSLGERIENRPDSFRTGWVETEDFCFCAGSGLLRLDEGGRLRQVLEDGRTVPVLSPDFELRHLQVLPQKGWLLLSPVQALRDSHGQASSLLLIDPARGIARGLLSDGFTLLPDADPQNEPVRLHRDGSLVFTLQDELNGRIDTARWSEFSGQTLTAAPVRVEPDRALPMNRFVFLDFEHPTGCEAQTDEPPVRAESSGVWVYEWDSGATPAGPVTLTVHARDAAGSSGEDSVRVNLARVHLDLQGERRMAQAWSFQRPYGYLEISARGEEAEIASLRLLRRVNEGDFVVLTTFSSEQLTPSPLVYHDKYLQKDQSYSYRLEALDASGQTLGFSPDLTL